MINKRRIFFQQLITGSAFLAAYPWLAQLKNIFEEIDLEKNEVRYWKKIRNQYSLSKKYIDLNNAGVNPQSKVVQESVSFYEKLSNEIPSLNMWQIIDKDKVIVKQALAEMIGCAQEDLAIQRNTTEALETIIFGVQLKKGDEVVLSKHDYPHMKFAWNQRAERDGIKLKWVELDLPSSDPAYILEQFKSQITNQTKMVCITHITNWNGQVYPIKEIATYAKSQGADVLVDAAHTIGQRNINVSELDIDYLASSLHKWLGAPFGTGVLYVKKGKRRDVYPLFAGPNGKAKGMHKFEHLGTRAVSHERSILPAIIFCNSIGIERKRKRLQYLKMYVVDQIKTLPRVEILSPIDAENGSAILLFNIKGIDSAQLCKDLKIQWKIHTTISRNENLDGIRISPNVFTQTSELDKFIEAVRTFVV